MSTIKSSDEHLTLNADGSSKDIKFQANGVEKASIDSSGNLTVSGNLTSVGIDDNADATAITIDSSEKVGIGTTSPTQQLHSYNTNAHRLRVANANYGIDLHQPAGASSPHINAYGTDVSVIFDINDSEKMRIDSTGAVTMPSQPAFQAFGSVGNQDIDPSSSWNTIVLGTERFDNNADFSANTFTAPVTGKYQLNALVYLLNADSAASYSEIQIKTSNKVYQAILSTNQFNGDLSYLTLMASALADMDANDTAYVQVNIGGGAAQTDVSAGTVFSGYLAC